METSDFGSGCAKVKEAQWVICAEKTHNNTETGVALLIAERCS